MGAYTLYCGKCRQLENMADMDERIVDGDLVYWCAKCIKENKPK